jgi:septal ring factor EnvC (AmiA/AmiB activator)
MAARQRGGKSQPAGKAGSTSRARGLMSASPTAWIGIAVAVVSLLSTTGQWLFAYAELKAAVHRIQTEAKRENEFVKSELKRNFDDDKERNKEFARAVERIDTTIGNFSKLDNKIAVIETELKAVNETLKELRQDLRRDRRSEAKGHSHHK